MQGLYLRTLIILVAGVTTFVLVMIALRRLSRWAQRRADRVAPPFDMLQLNTMRDEGKITTEEFERLRELNFKRQPIDPKNAKRAFEVIPREDAKT